MAREADRLLDYAATIHKAQGMTVDRTHVLATPGMDAHGSYVALSRHRDGMDLHYGRDDFANQDRLARTLSRDRSKDMATDYEHAEGRRRGLLAEDIAFAAASTGPERRQALKAKPLRGGAEAPALTACHRPGNGLSKQAKADCGRVRAPIPERGGGGAVDL